MENSDRPAFLTGSRAYGLPRPDSDWDVVIYGTKSIEEVLRGLADGTGFPLKIGKLNLIVAKTPRQYDAWRRGTDELRREAPVTRARAVEAFKQLGVGDAASGT